MESVTFEETIGKEEKLCFDCKTSKTPLWRSGPAGPKSLCNACGIRFRKKKTDKKKEKPDILSSASPSPTSSATDDNNTMSRSYRKREISEDVRGDMRIKVMAMGREAVVLQRPRSPRSPMKKLKRIENEYTMKRKKFGEVEEAAYLLMCLSYG